MTPRDQAEQQARAWLLEQIRSVYPEHLQSLTTLLLATQAAMLETVMAHIDSRIDGYRYETDIFAHERVDEAKRINNWLREQAQVRRTG